MSEVLWNIDQVLEKTGMSRSTLYRLRERGQFPCPWKVRGQLYWVKGTVLAWMQEVPAIMEGLKSARYRLEKGYTATEVVRDLKMGDSRIQVTRLALEKLTQEGVLKRRKVRTGGRPRVEFVPKP